MTFIALIFIALGCYLVYKGYKKKWFNTKAGESVKEYQERLLQNDPNELMKGQVKNGFIKAVGFFGGLFLILIGFMLLLFGLMM